MMLHDRSSSLTEAAAWCSIINSCKAQLNWIKCLYLLLSSKHRLPHNPPASSGSVSGCGDSCPFCCSSDLSFCTWCQFQWIFSTNFKGHQGAIWPCPSLSFSATGVSNEPFPLCNKCLYSVCSTLAYYNLQILVTLPAVIAPGISLNYLCCHELYTLPYLDNACF